MKVTHYFLPDDRCDVPVFPVFVPHVFSGSRSPLPVALTKSGSAEGFFVFLFPFQQKEHIKNLLFNHVSLNNRCYSNTLKIFLELFRLNRTASPEVFEIY